MPITNRRGRKKQNSGRIWESWAYDSQLPLSFEERKSQTYFKWSHLPISGAKKN